jgi:hypothetical protein
MKKNNFQAESKKTGTEFEKLVKDDLLSRGYKILSCNTEIDDIGINVDYLAQKNELLEHGEAKGGKTGPKKRPGAKRTDNVKKAICNGALLKYKDKTAVYVVYFSEKPKKDSASDKMIRTALEANFIDEVRYLKY